MPARTFAGTAVVAEKLQLARSKLRSESA